MAPVTTYAQSRSPTPPPDSALQESGLDHAFHFLKTASFDFSPTDLNADHTSASASLQTPPHSSPIAAAAERRDQQSRASRKRKRVVFGETSFDKGAGVNDTPTNANGTNGKTQQPKSILKAPTMPSDGADADDSVPQLDGTFSSSEEESAGSMDTMLGSLMQQLKSLQPESHHDAYRTLAQMLKAQDISSQLDAFKEQLPFLEETIRTDITQHSTQLDERMSMALVGEALKLSAVLIHESNRNHTLPISIDFQRFMVLNSMGELQTGTAPKQISRLHTVLLREVKITEHMLSAEHTMRLIEVLCDSNDRESSTNFLLQRIHIFNSLLTHHASVMIHNADIWMDCLASTMLAKSGQIRQAAIAFGLKVGSRPTPSVGLSNSLLALFQRQDGEGKSFLDDFVEQLGRMVEDTETKYDVPAIWSVVIMFSRAKKSEYLTSDAHTKLLTMFQKCFNTFDPQLKRQAFWAWDKFVFCVYPSLSTKRQTVSNICAVFKASQMRSNSVCKTVQDSSHLLHLYYALRPRQPEEKTTDDYFDRLDMYWQELVEKSLHEKRHYKPASFQKILIALLSFQNDAPWDPQRALRTENEPLRVEELPALDSTWVRSNISKILKIIEPLLSYNADEKSDVVLIWRTLLQSIAHASSREVTFSAPLRQVVTAITKSLVELWTRGPSSLGLSNGDSLFIRRFSNLVQDFGRNIHPRYLRDALISPSELEDGVASTNLVKHKLGSEKLSPVAIVVALLGSSLGVGPYSIRPEDSSAIYLAFVCLMDKFEGNNVMKVEFLTSILAAQLHRAPSESTGNAADSVWLAAVDYCLQYLDSSTQTDEYRLDLVKSLLKLLMLYRSYKPSSQGGQAAKRLTLTIFRSCDTEQARVDVLNHYLDPLSKELIAMAAGDVAKHSNSFFRSNTVALLEVQIEWMSKSQDTTTNSDPSDPNTALVETFKSDVTHLVGDLIEQAYREINFSDSHLTFVHLLERVAARLSAGSVDDGEDFAKILNGLNCVARDTTGLLAHATEDDQASLFNIRKIMQEEVWPLVLQEVLKKLKNYSPQKSRIPLDDTLITGFRSPLPGVANTTLDFWNQSISPCLKSLGTSDALAGILKRLSGVLTVARIPPLAKKVKPIAYVASDKELFPGLFPEHTESSNEESEKGSWISQTSFMNKEFEACNGQDSSKLNDATVTNHEALAFDGANSEARADRVIDTEVRSQNDPAGKQHGVQDPEPANGNENGLPSFSLDTENDPTFEAEDPVDNSFTAALRNISSHTSGLEPTLPSTPRKSNTENRTAQDFEVPSLQDSISSTSEDQVFVDANSSPLRPRSANKPPTPRYRGVSSLRSQSEPNSVSKSTKELPKNRTTRSSSQNSTSVFSSAASEPQANNIAGDATISQNIVTEQLSQSSVEPQQDSQDPVDLSLTGGSTTSKSEPKKGSGIWKKGKWAYVVVSSGSSDIPSQDAEGDDTEDSGIVLRSGKRRKMSPVDGQSPPEPQSRAPESSGKKRSRSEAEAIDDELLPKTRSRKSNTGEAVPVKEEEEEAFTYLSAPHEPILVESGSSAGSREASPARTNSEELQEVGEALGESFMQTEPSIEPAEAVDIGQDDQAEEVPFDKEVAQRIRGKVLPLLQQALPELGALQLQISTHEDNGGDEMLNTAYSIGQLQAMILNLQQDTLKTLRGSKTPQRM